MVRTQLDHFQRAIPLVWDSFTVYALDLPGMGWSGIVPGARYEEPDLRAAVVEFVTGLDLYDVTLAGESLGAALSLSTSIDVNDRVRRVVAFNSYDYPSGVERGNWFARLIITSMRMPGSGRVFAEMENRPILRGVMRGGFADRHNLPEDFLAELRRSGSRPGYPTVARAIYRSLKGFIEVRRRYPDAKVPVTRSIAIRTGRVPRSASRWPACWAASKRSRCPQRVTSPRSNARPRWPGSC